MNNLIKKRYTHLSPVRKEHGDTSGFQDLNQALQNERTAITKSQRDVTDKLAQLDEKCTRPFGTIMLRRADKKLMSEIDKARSEATDVILSSRNECLRVGAETMVRYNKLLANSLLMTLETSNGVALEGHFMEAKFLLFEKMENLNRRFVALLHEKEIELEAASETIKPMLKDQGLTLMSTWMDDYEKIISEFSNIRDQKFK